ncbi:hypothetical protein KAK07_02880 [Ideonella sp. 4Y16]|uniref:hypothetical protein n=1 Tax=Ideonella alba TaxID=2824118 RepID=UPI001B373FA1|nr:hypothetical protein [Ideonella alba]MBQ0942275.1 hypothetical protein [Ideonella alba]
MSRPFKTMEELRRHLQSGAASRSATPTAAPPAGPHALSTSQVHQTLIEQVGEMDLGRLGNWRARRHQRAEEERMHRTLTTARAEQAAALMREKLQGEVEIIRMRFSQDFSDRIAALAESAAASQVMVMRKLKAIEAEARNFVMYDLKAETDELQDMLVNGVIDEPTFHREASFRLQGYEALKQRFSDLMDAYQNTVQHTYQGHPR